VPCAALEEASQMTNQPMASSPRKNVLMVNLFIGVAEVYTTGYWPGQTRFEGRTHPKSVATTDYLNQA